MKNQTTKCQIELLLVLYALFLFPVQILIGATISVSGRGFSYLGNQIQESSYWVRNIQLYTTTRVRIEKCTYLTLESIAEFKIQLNQVELGPS